MGLSSQNKLSQSGQRGDGPAVSETTRLSGQSVEKQVTMNDIMALLQRNRPFIFDQRPFDDNSQLLSLKNNDQRGIGLCGIVGDSSLDGELWRNENEGHSVSPQRSPMFDDDEANADTLPDGTSIDDEEDDPMDLGDVVRRTEGGYPLQDFSSHITTLPRYRLSGSNSMVNPATGLQNLGGVNGVSSFCDIALVSDGNIISGGVEDDSDSDDGWQSVVRTSRAPAALVSCQQQGCRPPQRGKPMPFILYESNNVLVIYKPPFWHCSDPSPAELSEVAAKQSGKVDGLEMSSRAESLHVYISLKWSSGISSSLLSAIDMQRGLCHRLDRDTSGPLLVARNAASWRFLRRQQRLRSVSKEYILLCHGRPAVQFGIVEAPLARDGRRMRACSANEPTAQDSLTCFRVLGEYRVPSFVSPTAEHGRVLSLVWVRLITGRTHQIRVHFAQVLGCPLVSDHQYGSLELLERDAKWCRRLFLHCQKLSFPDPQGENVSCSPSMLHLLKTSPIYANAKEIDASVLTRSNATSNPDFASQNVSFDLKDQQKAVEASFASLDVDCLQKCVAPSTIDISDIKGLNFDTEPIVLSSESVPKSPIASASNMKPEIIQSNPSNSPIVLPSNKPDVANANSISLTYTTVPVPLPDDLAAALRRCGDLIPSPDLPAELKDLNSQVQRIPLVQVCPLKSDELNLLRNSAKSVGCYFIGGDDPAPPILSRRRDQMLKSLTDRFGLDIQIHRQLRLLPWEQVSKISDTLLSSVSLTRLPRPNILLPSGVPDPLCDTASRASEVALRHVLAKFLKGGGGGEDE